MKYTSDSEIQGQVGFRSLNATFKVVSLNVADESTESDVSVVETYENEEIAMSDSKI